MKVKRYQVFHGSQVAGIFSGVFAGAILSQGLSGELSVLTVLGFSVLGWLLGMMFGLLVTAEPD